MKGGTTSGVVYPDTVVELAKVYRFVISAAPRRNRSSGNGHRRVPRERQRIYIRDGVK